VWSEGSASMADNQQLASFSESSLDRPDSPYSSGGTPFARTRSGRLVRSASAMYGSARDFMHASTSMGPLTAADKVKALMGSFICATALWFTLSSVLLILFGVQYDGLVVDQDRTRYVESAADRAACAAANVLVAGLGARDAVDSAIQSKLYFEPLDYVSLRAAMEPVFAGFPSLRAVDLAFTDREDSISIRRLMGDVASVGSFRSMERMTINAHAHAALAMQSSAQDCLALGERGCLSSAQARNQRWHHLASGLWGGEELDGFREPGEEVFRWDNQPGFIAADPARGGRADSIEWSPAYSLLFRVSFPGTSGNLSVLGRSVTDLSSLRADEHLSDLALGPKGAIYICDRAGKLLAAAQPGQQAFVQKQSGVFRFRHISELEAPWAAELKDFNGQGRSFSSSGFYVVVKPLGGRGMGNFAAVVAAQRDMFVDTRLTPILTSANVVSVLPYPVFILNIVGYYVYKEYARRRSMRRVHVLHEGVAQLMQESVPDEMQHDEPEYEGHCQTEKALAALRKRTIAKSVAVQRDAKISMSLYLEDSTKAKGNTELQLALQQMGASTG